MAGRRCKLDFYRQAVALVEKYRRPGQTVRHTFQTNGLLVDDEWCAFFKDHDFLVGLSVDGPRELHDTYRVDRRGRGTFDLVMRGWQALRRRGVEFNILCTVNAANQGHGRAVYRLFRDELDARWIQFIPIVERATAESLELANHGWSEQPGRPRLLYTQTGNLVTERTVGREQYGRFLVDVFEEWIRHDVGQVFVQLFDVTLEAYFGRHLLCIHRKAHAEGKPFFIWWNATHMHAYTHIPKEAEGISGQGFYNDAMLLHDRAVGRLLDLLDELGIAEDTIVQYSTDNGPHYNTWPDGAITPFRSEKNTNWEGAFRVPCFVRWPGKFGAGKVLNGIVTHQEWLPTLLAAAGEPDIVEKLKQGHVIGDKCFRVHIDGHNILPYLTGEVDESPRKSFFYIDDGGEATGFRFGDWKIVLLEQRAKTMQVWAEPFVELRVPKIFNLRRDPFERADENSNGYWNWVLEHSYIIPPAAAFIQKELQSFQEFPPRQGAPSFDIDKMIERLNKASDGSLN